MWTKTSHIHTMRSSQILNWSHIMYCLNCYDEKSSIWTENSPTATQVQKGIYFTNTFLPVVGPSLLVNTLCTYISLDHSVVEKLVYYQREVRPTAFHSSTMRFFLGEHFCVWVGHFCPDFLCTRWLSPKAPGIIRIPDVPATIDLG